MTRHFGAFHIDALQPADVPICASMTFPAYRHLLAQQPTTRLPSEPEQRLIQPVALVARSSAESGRARGRGTAGSSRGRPF